MPIPGDATDDELLGESCVDVASVGWLGSLVPAKFGNIDQRIIGRSIAAEIALNNREAGEVIRENAAMKKLAAQLNTVTAEFSREV